MQLDLYMPAGIAMLFAVGFCLIFTVVGIFVGGWRKTASLRSHAKLEPFECGSEPIGSPRGRYSVKFYQVALLFLVFDIEAAFMYPWALLYRSVLSRGVPIPGAPDGAVSLFGFAEMVVFVGILVVALTYVWRKKAIGWD